MLRLVLRCILIKLLLMRQLNRSSAIEELGCAIGRHILELIVIGETTLTSTDTSGVRARLHCSVSEDLAIKKGQVVGILATLEAMIGVAVRAELIDYTLSILTSSKELVGVTLGSLHVRLRASQVVD